VKANERGGLLAKKCGLVFKASTYADREVTNWLESLGRSDESVIGLDGESADFLRKHKTAKEVREQVDNIFERILK
jgi:hypothetical protein